MRLLRLPEATLTLALALGALGCDPTPAAVTDAGSDAGAAIDAAATDAAAPPSLFCQPCRTDPMCGEGGLCLEGEGGSLGCGTPCAGDEDCAGLSLPATCQEPFVGLGRVCVPTAGTCVVTAPGTRCAAASDCEGIYDVCADDLDPRGGVCTTTCRSDADCPFGMRHCREQPEGRVCVPDRLAARDVCAAQIEGGVIERCASDGSCPSGTTCHGSGTIRVCLAPAGASGCAGGSVERGVSGARVCVPTSAWGSELADCECALEEPGSMLDDGLTLIERTRCDLAYPTWLLEPLYPANPVLAQIGHDRFRLASIDLLHASWTHVPRFADGLAARFDDAAASARPITEALVHAAELADLDPEMAPSAPAASDLAAEIERFVVASGGTADRSAIDSEVAAIDASLASALAPLVAAMTEITEARAASLAFYTEAQQERLYDAAAAFHLGAVGRTTAPTAPWIQGALLGDVDVAGMARGAARLAAAIEAADLARFAGRSDAMTIETPVGRIAVRGASDDDYAGAAWERVALLVELGGDDTYRVPVGATTSFEHGVSVAIDVAGSDDYGYVEVPHARDVGPDGHVRLVSDAAGRNDPPAGAEDGPWSRSTTSRQGAGRLGVGMLVDLGDAPDVYRSHRMSQGYGALGVGVLYDAGGDDLYHGEAGVQGAASFGVGLLLDADGDDRYLAYHAAQGFAYARAVGVLHDTRGADTYFAHPSDVLYFSPQSRDSNASFTQGAGFGRRADSSDGVFMSGGVALLRDASGDDRYTCGIFGQATGYWFGAGFLLDGGGVDHYDGEWYVQAGDAHFGIAAFIDYGPEGDFYNELAVRRNAAHGGGHDFSVAWLIDEGGDDLHRAPGLSLGTGYAGGFGGFVDMGGADTYDVTRDLAYGHASIETPGDGLRRLTGTRGLFLELGGTDSYARPTLGDVANDAQWTQRLHEPADEELGAGIDRASGSIGLPRR